MHEFLAAMFVFGGLWFWVVVLAWFGSLMWVSETESNVVGTIVTVLLAWGFLSYNDFNVSVAAIIITILTYVATGAVWSVVKWMSFVRKHVAKFVTFKREWIRSNKRKYPALANASVETDFATLNDNIDDINRAFIADCREHFRYESRSGDIIPTPATNKNRITTWIIWWPASMIWTLIDDPFMRLVNWVIDELGNLYTNIAQHAFAKYKIPGYNVDE